ALAHRELPVVGVQFHPESILTEHGYELLAGFLRTAGLDVAVSPTMADERPPMAPRTIPSTPVTF
ncbi:MAG TPA: aminodeoxychorismate/anthranilate synthase component II, partial [Pirellulales bacterium]|nr:aminodeoxychorismate/anthranilate synthase component II [Pirellulales bacterium]